MRRTFSFMLVFLFLVGCQALNVGITQDLRLHFINVGQGDSVLIQSGDRAALYDGGVRSSGVLQYLQAIGLTSLDLVIASHADADHIGGLIDVVRHYKPRFFMDNEIPHTTRTYEDLLLAVEEAGSQVLEPTARRIGLGETDLHVIPPPQKPSWGQNENSVGLVIEHGEFRAALTGDAEHQETQWWLANYPELLQPVDVYKSAHHGSPNGDTPSSINAFQPDVVVISVGRNNQYGHPAPEILALYESVGAATYRTDEHGTVVVESDGQTYTVQPQQAVQPRAPPALPAARSTEQPTQPSLTNCIDINTASSQELQRIIHIGPARAESLMMLRPFRSVDDLTRVSGIGPGRLADIKAQGVACVRN